MLFKIKAYYFVIGLYFFIGHLANAQDQRVADSLLAIYKTDTLRGEARLILLKNLSFNTVDDYHLALKYADQLIALATQENNLAYQAHGYLRKGNAEKLLGNLEAALNAFFETAEIAKKDGRIPLEGSAYINIADIYAMALNHKNAMHYYHLAIATLRKSEDNISLASAILNAGDAHLTNKDYDSALVYFKESGAIFERSNYLIGKAYNLGNIGMVYAGQGQIDLAEKNIDEAIQILIAHGDYYPISVYLLSMADIFLEKGDSPSALNYTKRSLALAQQYGLKEQISTANLKLSERYEAMGLTTESLKYYKDYVAARDTLNNIEKVQTLADMRTDYEISQKQVEVDLLNQQKRNQMIILAFSGVLLLTLFWYYRTISREKKRSEDLLLNILPSEIAHELKQNGAVEAVKCDDVTVLFTDFVQFSKKAELIDPQQLVKSIDFYFKKFDEITTKYGLEKIKTIGDSYMCACGLPSPDPNHASNAVKAAKEMIGVVKDTLNDKDGLSHFEVRVGLHSGPVVAGIVGIKKWQYDIWGDTVNIASRMESNSEPGRINLSETTYREIKEEFACEYRGEIEVKHRGFLKMYFLS